MFESIFTSPSKQAEFYIKLGLKPSIASQAAKCSKECLINNAMAMTECDLQDENYTQISVQTLIIHGENDIASSLENDAKRIHSLIKNSRLEVLKDTNHFPPTEKTTEVIKFMREFIKSI